MSDTPPAPSDRPVYGQLPYQDGPGTHEWIPTAEQPFPPPTQQWAPQPPVPPQQPKSRRWIAWAAGGVALIIVVLVVAVVALGSSSKNDSAAFQTKVDGIMTPVISANR